MAWPPTLPPDNRTNTTTLHDNHPADHNLIADALGDIVTKIQTGGLVGPQGPPGMIPDNGALTNADFNTLVGIGMYRVNGGTNGPPNVPTQFSLNGTLIVYTATQPPGGGATVPDADSSQVTQQFIQSPNATGDYRPAYERSGIKVLGAWYWSGWSTLSFDDQGFKSGVDLNTLTYTCSVRTTSPVNGPTNAPTTHGQCVTFVGQQVVTVGGANQGLIQFYAVLAGPQVWVRTASQANSGGAWTWQAWRSIVALAYLVAKSTTPTAADYGLTAIPTGAVWVQTP